MFVNDLLGLSTLPTGMQEQLDGFVEADCQHYRDQNVLFESLKEQMFLIQAMHCNTSADVSSWTLLC